MQTERERADGIERTAVARSLVRILHAGAPSIHLSQSSFEILGAVALQCAPLCTPASLDRLGAPPTAHAATETPPTHDTKIEEVKKHNFRNIRDYRSVRAPTLSRSSVEPHETYAADTSRPGQAPAILSSVSIVSRVPSSVHLMPCAQTPSPQHSCTLALELLYDHAPRCTTLESPAAHQRTVRL